MFLSSVKLFLIYFLKPGGDNKSYYQTTLTKVLLVPKAPVNKTRTIGFKNYFSTIIATLKQNNIIPVTILFNDQQTRLNSKSNEYFHNDELEYSIKRRGRVIKLHNSIMDSIGIKEKAKFIEQYLVKHFSLNKNINNNY